jgi:hypothetical protein
VLLKSHKQTPGKVTKLWRFQMKKYLKLVKSWILVRIVLEFGEILVRKG